MRRRSCVDAPWKLGLASWSMGPTQCGDVVRIERLEGQWWGDVVGLERLGSRSRDCATQRARAEPKFQALDSQDKCIMIQNPSS